MANELVLGTRRVGDFAEFDPNTPEVKVVLERTDRGIGITVPWSNDDSPYALWFLGNEGSARRRPASENPQAPSRVVFGDSYGFLMLIGCQASSFHTKIRGPGSGTLWSRAAILGVRHDVDFEHPNGMQSDITGLRSWLGSSSWDENTTHGYKSTETVIRSLLLPDLRIGECAGLQLTFQFNWSTSRENGGDRLVLTDDARCVTRGDGPVSWENHLKLHYAVRDLLVLSRWHRESCHEVFALHLDDPLESVDGQTHGEQWREVVVPDTAKQTAPRKRRAHLIEYEDLGPAGVLRWIHLRDEFARALDPVISSIELKGTAANTFLAHTGPGLEALGYLLLLRDGVSSTQAGKATLRRRLERILEDLNGCLPFDGEKWVSSTCKAYNGLKHANRDKPDWLDVMNSWRECVLVVRSWVAVELGVSTETLKQRLSIDSQRHPFVEVG